MPSEPAAALSSTVRHFLVSQSQSLELQASRPRRHLHHNVPACANEHGNLVRHGLTKLRFSLFYSRSRAHETQTGAAFHPGRRIRHWLVSSHANLSVAHRPRLFGVSRRPLVRLLEGVVDFGVHAVHALRPLAVNHSPFLLTAQRGKKQQMTSTEPAGLKSDRRGGDLTFCPGYDLLLCAALSRTCHTV